MPLFPLRPLPLALAAAMALAGVSLHAQESGAALPTAAVPFNIAAQPLSQALRDWALQTRQQLIVQPALVDGKMAPALSGQLTPQQALDRLLSGSGLVAAAVGNAIVIKAAPPAAGAASLPVVTVAAAASAESRATTEGLPEYATRATTIGLGEHSLRETPNSVSVITRQRIDDQNFLNIEDAMRYSTASKVTTYGTSRFQVESRGYSIDRYQTDGISSSSQLIEGSFGLAMVDRIEVWRGPAGLLQGAGDPGGTINFVRKRAQNTFGFNAKVVAGTWDNYYAEADLTGPLDSEGRLRGRLVAAYQDRDYFTDHTFTRQPLFYGTLEYDFSPDTTLSVGHSAQRTRYRPFYGLPAYAAGGLPDVARSTYLGSLWSLNGQTIQRSFAELEHRLDGGGKAVLSASYLDRAKWSTATWVNSRVDPSSGNVTVRPYFDTIDEQETNLQGVLTLPTQWRGLPQEFVLGASYQRLRWENAYNAPTYGRNDFVQNVFAPHPDVPWHDETLATTGKTDTRQQAIFGQARIRPWQSLVLLAGARATWYENRNLLDRANDSEINGKVVPYAGAIYELTPQWSVYGSYSSIFNPQTSRDRSGAYLQPRKGNQVEAGFKGEHLDGRLQSSFSVYRIEDVNRAMMDPDFPDASIAAGKVRSQGLEAEVTGRLSPRWNLTAGYGYNTTKYLEAEPDMQGKAFTTFYPRHLFSLWSDWRLDGGWSVGAGARLRSAIYAESGAVRWTSGGMAVFALQGGYQINPRTRLTVTVNNLFDRKYWERVQGGSRQNHFGEPRNVLATLSYKY